MLRAYTDWRDVVAVGPALRTLSGLQRLSVDFRGEGYMVSNGTLQLKMDLGASEELGAAFCLPLPKRSSSRHHCPQRLPPASCALLGCFAAELNQSPSQSCVPSFLSVSLSYEWGLACLLSILPFASNLLFGLIGCSPARPPACLQINARLNTLDLIPKGCPGAGLTALTSLAFLNCSRADYKDRLLGPFNALPALRQLQAQFEGLSYYLHWPAVGHKDSSGRPVVVTARAGQRWELERLPEAPAMEE